MQKTGKALTRRRFLQWSAGSTAIAGGTALALGKRETLLPPPDDGWRAGGVAHILPTVDHQRFLIKVSFHQRPASAPILRVNELSVPGQQTDSEGLFYRFDVNGLQAAHTYRLQLLLDDGSALCDEWPLKTFPAPDADVDTFRLLAYTCAGGPDNLYNFGFFNAYLPNSTRQHLFARGLSFQPDAVVANGDHVYWDLKSSAFMGNSLRAKMLTGLFDPELPVLGSDNEQVLKAAIGPQIAGLYGVQFRSTPMFFIRDDHDYGENDEADDTLRTFPADRFMLDLADSTQRLYYPELLSSTDLPEPYRQQGCNGSFGSLRFGRLFEAMLYDCRRHLSNQRDPALADSESLFVPAAIEQWLLSRTLSSDARHIAHMPSTPILWTAGKWAEWYPDVKQSDGSLGIASAKPYWPRGWLQQHDRLLGAAASRRDRLPLFISGDLHATGSGRILGNQGVSYADNPVYSILTGALGTGALGWPSRFRGTVPVPSVVLDTEVLETPVEENGFSVMEFTRHTLQLDQYKWLPERGEAQIATLEQFSSIELPQPLQRGA